MFPLLDHKPTSVYRAMHVFDILSKILSRERI
jgi:hypothetical protein